MVLINKKKLRFKYLKLQFLEKDILYKADNFLIRLQISIHRRIHTFYIFCFSQKRKSSFRSNAIISLYFWNTFLFCKKNQWCCFSAFYKRKTNCDFHSITNRKTLLIISILDVQVIRYFVYFLERKESLECPGAGVPQNLVGAEQTPTLSGPGHFWTDPDPNCTGTTSCGSGYRQKL